MKYDENDPFRGLVKIVNKFTEDSTNLTYLMLIIMIIQICLLLLEMI